MHIMAYVAVFYQLANLVQRKLFILGCAVATSGFIYQIALGHTGRASMYLAMAVIFGVQYFRVHVGVKI